MGDFAGATYTVERAQQSVTGGPFELVLARRGQVKIEKRLVPVSIQKRFSLWPDASRFSVRYRITNEGTQSLKTQFAAELNVTLLAPSAPDRFFVIGDEATKHEMASRGMAKTFSRMRLVDDWNKIDAELSTDRAGQLFWYPVETVSQSEQGMERTYQGTCLVLGWFLDLEAGQSQEFTVHFLESGAPSA